MNGRVQRGTVWVTSLESMNGRVQRDRVRELCWTSGGDRGESSRGVGSWPVGAGDEEAEGSPANEEARRGGTVRGSTDRWSGEGRRRRRRRHWNHIRVVERTWGGGKLAGGVGAATNERRAVRSTRKHDEAERCAATQTGGGRRRRRRRLEPIWLSQTYFNRKLLSKSEQPHTLIGVFRGLGVVFSVRDPVFLRERASIRFFTMRIIMR